MANVLSEDDIERTLVRRLVDEFGFETLNCDTDDRENTGDVSGRADKRDVTRTVVSRSSS